MILNEGDVTINEGGMGGLAGTMDQRISSHPSTNSSPGWTVRRYSPTPSRPQHHPHFIGHWPPAWEPSAHPDRRGLDDRQHGRLDHPAHKDTSRRATWSTCGVTPDGVQRHGVPLMPEGWRLSAAPPTTSPSAVYSYATSTSPRSRPPRGRRGHGRRSTRQDLRGTYARTQRADPDVVERPLLRLRLRRHRRDVLSPDSSADSS